MMKRHFWSLIFIFSLAGCAKFPATSGPSSGKRLVFTMTVAGRIRGDVAGIATNPYIYMVALRLSQDPNPRDQGPIPVVAPPWGNGFVAGNSTHFVWWNPLTSPRYQLYRFRDATLNEWFSLGAPVSFIEVNPGSATLRFELDLAQLEPVVAERDRLQAIQLNFLTMDRIPQSGVAKNWDALGDSRRPTQINSPVTIPLRTSGIYNNNTFSSLEPRGDQADPDLDIVDWSVEVRLQ